jgi:UDP-N-acetylmuramyl pentapeptide phosphotransferase/UDP-N-acetylglucosamine-1-phosphate transferase
VSYEKTDMEPEILMLALVGSGLIAFALSYLGVLGLRHWSPRLGLMDVPNTRSSHTQPTPRGGGLAFVLVSVATTLAAAMWSGTALPTGAFALLVSSLLVAAISLADDRWRLSARTRFIAHIAGALILVTGGGLVREIVLPWGTVWILDRLSVPFTLLWIVGVANAFNFMDGIDGLVAGQAIVAAMAIMWMAQIYSLGNVVLVMLILATSVLGFLLHNWPPARIFMGDVGSAFLGFVFAGWAVVFSGARSGALPFLAWAGVLGLFLFDAGLTLGYRILRGERWYEAHREHFYQRLIRRGWSHAIVTSLYTSAATLLHVMFSGADCAE